MEKELHTLDARRGWFEYKYKETLRELEAARSQVSLLDKALRNLEVDFECQKETAARAVDEASDFGINASFKVFKRLLLESYPNFDIKSLEARLTDELIHKAMDDAEKERAAAREATGPSGSNVVRSPVWVGGDSEED